MKHAGEYRRALSRFACDNESYLAPIPRQEIVACLDRAPASFRGCLSAKIGHERFRFGGNREPQFMWPLMIRHLGNSWPPNLVDADTKHNASRGAVTAITDRKQKGWPESRPWWLRQVVDPTPRRRLSAAPGEPLEWPRSRAAQLHREQRRGLKGDVGGAMASKTARAACFFSQVSDILSAMT
jgi:hypothetical protein